MGIVVRPYAYEVVDCILIYRQGEGVCLVSERVEDDCDTNVQEYLSHDDLEG